jgi:hypothetical protein
MSPGHKKRLSRIARRGTPQIKAAFEAGKLSARICDTLLYLAPAEQTRELTRRLRAQDEAEHRSRLAAETIRQYLDSCSKVDLMELGRQIRAAIA